MVAFWFGLNEFGYTLTAKDIPAEVVTYARTMAFVVLACTQLFYSLSLRSSTKSIFQVGLFSNMYLIGAIVIGISLQFAVITIPVFANAFKVHNLSLRDWLFVMGFSLIPLAVNELIKAATRALKKE